MGHFSKVFPDKENNQITGQVQNQEVYLLWSQERTGELEEGSLVTEDHKYVSLMELRRLKKGGFLGPQREYGKDLDVEKPTLEIFKKKR